MRMFIAAAAFCLGFGTVHAATLDQAGAYDLVVDGVIYDVAFEPGSCIGVFDGCDEPSDFTFSTEAEAILARDALLALLETYPAFDNDPTFGNGCSSTSLCQFFVLHGTAAGNILHAFFGNYQLFNTTGVTTNPISTSAVLSGSATYTKWTEIGVVPLPASALLLVFAMGGLAAVGRSRKS